MGKRAKKNPTRPVVQQVYYDELVRRRHTDAIAGLVDSGYLSYPERRFKFRTSNELGGPVSIPSDKSPLGVLLGVVGQDSFRMIYDLNANRCAPLLDRPDLLWRYYATRSHVYGLENPPKFAKSLFPMTATVPGALGRNTFNAIHSNILVTADVFQTTSAGLTSHWTVGETFCMDEKLYPYDGKLGC